MRRRLLLACALAAVAAVAAGADRVTGRPAVATSTLTASPQEVHEALLSALREWGVAAESPSAGRVRTAWVSRRAGEAALRERVVAEHEADGYVTRLVVRHERERRLDDLRAPSLGGPAASWRAADGDHDVAKAVVRSVERALGHEPELLPLDSLRRPDPAPAVVHERREHVVPPEAAVRINRLKVRRREIVAEIRAIDARILAAVGEDRLEELRAELPALRARKDAFAEQVTAIDREILALVLAEE